jgi:glucoamylase
MKFITRTSIRRIRAISSCSSRTGRASATRRSGISSTGSSIQNSDRGGRYRIIKDVIGEPHSSVLLVHTRIEILDERLRGKLQLFALLAPHLKGTGAHNSARCEDTEGRRLFQAEREGIHLAFGCAPDFKRRSVGYAGTSDGWQDLMGNFRMDWTYQEANDGNIALTGEIDLSQGLEFVLAVGFGLSAQSAAVQLLQALATPFAEQRDRFVRQWQRTRCLDELSGHTGDGGHLLRISRCVLLAHEDKAFPGAFVASLSIPWGETKDDSDQGGYHLVWARDLVQTATALLAGGRTESPLRALIWLACTQRADGSMPQNSSITGQPFWQGIQLDEVGVPILLAWRLRREKALLQFDPWPMIARAARYQILQGPVTAQERWEENSGLSPSTLATIIAALVAAADFARDREDGTAAEVLVAYADWLSSRLEAWTVTDRGELLPGTPRHFVRITPADTTNAARAADPNTAVVPVANGGGEHPARNVVGGDFLQLVRLGVRAADDPLIVASVSVIDHVLKRDLPDGPCWRRYNHDGYGQKDDGSAFDGTGVGRSWPILAGERGHYELAAGRDAAPFIAALEKFANAGALLPEQLWDAPDLPKRHMKFGRPTGSAMPLCWAHAEYLSLVRSRRDGVAFDRIEPAYQRYARGGALGEAEMWTFAHQPAQIPKGWRLRLFTEPLAKVRWTADAWATAGELEATACSLGLHWVDLPTAGLPAGATVIFTFYWPQADRWEGRNFQVTVASKTAPGGGRP